MANRETPQPLDLQVPSRHAINKALINSDVSLGKMLQEVRERRHQENEHVKPFRNMLRNHIANMQSAAQRTNDSQGTPEKPKRHSRGKSAAGNHCNTISDFYTHEISEIITRASQNWMRGANQTSELLSGTRTEKTLSPFNQLSSSKRLGSLMTKRLERPQTSDLN